VAIGRTLRPSRGTLLREKPCYKGADPENAGVFVISRWRPADLQSFQPPRTRQPMYAAAPVGFIQTRMQIASGRVGPHTRDASDTILSEMTATSSACSIARDG